VFRIASTCLLAIGISAAALGAPAVAEPRAAAFDASASLSHPISHPSIRHAGANNSWGGYAVTGGSFDSVTGDWTVPALNCSATAGDISFWSGLDGWTSETVEQIGLDAVCTKSGTVEYNPWVEMYPADSIYFSDVVKAGDEMTSSVTTNGSGSFTLVLADPTQGWTKTYTKSLASAALSSAEVIVEAIGSQTIPPCPNFGQIQFTDVTANGDSFADAGTTNTTNLERRGVLLTQDGSLTGTSFPVTWLHA